MFYVTIDCGTTNSRAYIVDSRGKVYGKAVKQVGVRDTAVTGSKDTLREGLREVIEQAAREAGTAVGELGAVLRRYCPEPPPGGGRWSRGWRTPSCPFTRREAYEAAVS